MTPRAWLVSQSQRRVTAMSFRPPELVIDPDDPFKKDTLSRKSQVEALCGVIETDERPLVVAVDGKFGSGKSTFLAMCAAHLRQEARLQQQEAAVAEFNAWQHSHTKNPLIDLISALIRQVPQSERLKRVAAGIGWGVVSAVSQGAINRQNFQQADTESLFKLWHDIEEQRQAFHHELAGVVQEAGGPLVVFLDELDRCMPQQALDYLNIVRHLFDVPGVAVVIGVNQDELAHRVRQLYGDRCNADSYLRRFWDFTMPLREPSSKQMTTFLNRVFHDASERLNAADGNVTDEFWKLLVEQSGMSLRDIQQTVHYFARVLASVPLPDRSGQNPFDAGETYEHLVLTAFAVRVIDRDTYNKLIAGEFDLFQAAASFRRKLILTGDSRYVGDYLTALVLCLDLHDFLNVKDEAFVERFVEAGVGDKELGAAIQEMCKGIRPRLINATSSLAHLDSLLSLTG